MGTTNRAIGGPLKTWTEHTGPRSIYILVGLTARPTAGNPYYTATSLKMLFLNNPFPITFHLSVDGTLLMVTLNPLFPLSGRSWTIAGHQ